MDKQQHYFSANPTAASHPQKIESLVRGQVLQLRTDHGVFSRSKVDQGSLLLAEHAVVPSHACVLDLGAGYGPVGIAVAKSDPTVFVWMVDINERALQLAKDNAQQNGVANQVEFQTGDGLSNMVPNQLFDVILLNPPIRAGKETVFRLYREALGRMKCDGSFFVVIQKKQGFDSTKRYLQTICIDVSMIAKDQGYRVLQCRGSCSQVENSD